MNKKTYGGHSNISKIERILMKKPQQAYRSQDIIARQWKALNYPSETDFNKAKQEYNDFLAYFQQENIAIEFLPEHPDTGLDSIYTHDPVFIFDRGAIILNMGKSARQGETQAVSDFLGKTDIPIAGQISGNGMVEGGDFFWVDSQTIAIAEGYRTNMEGISQLRNILGNGIEVIPVPLPHWTGPEDCLHLLSMISPLDNNLAVVYSRLMSVPFRNLLLERGYQLVEVPDEEYESMACNVLAVGPRKCIMLEGNPITQQRLVEAGVEIATFKGEEICLKGAGGPTCLTRPILRSGAKI